MASKRPMVVMRISGPWLAALTRRCPRRPIYGQGEGWENVELDLSPCRRGVGDAYRLVRQPFRRRVGLPEYRHFYNRPDGPRSWCSGLQGAKDQAAVTIKMRDEATAEATRVLAASLWAELSNCRIHTVEMELWLRVGHRITSYSMRAGVMPTPVFMSVVGSVGMLPSDVAFHVVHAYTYVESANRRCQRFIEMQNRTLHPETVQNLVEFFLGMTSSSIKRLRLLSPKPD